MKSMTSCRFALAGTVVESRNASNILDPDGVWAIFIRSSTGSAKILPKVIHEDHQNKVGTAAYVSITN